MKKLFSVLLSFWVLVTLCSCKGKDTTQEEEPPARDAAELVSDAFVDPINGWDAYDDLVARIKTETDKAKRTQLMHQAEDMLMANGCVIPLYYYNDVYMAKDYVDGVYANRFGYKFFEKVTLQNDSNTLRVNLSSEPSTLDPALNSTVDGACLVVNSFAGLFTYDETGKTVPDLATGYTVSDPAEDGTVTYTVTLRSGLRWSDGSELTATDFEKSWKRAASTATAADYGYMFNMFEGYPNQLAVTATDPTTLEFTLTNPCAYMEGLLASPTFFPVPSAALDEENPGSWCTEAGFVSNGPFVCTGWNHDVSMTYEKNPYYHRASEVTLDKLECMLSSDATAIYAAYNAGNVDVIDTVPTDVLSGLLESENTQLHVIDNLGTYYVGFNANSDLFAGKTPEQAACMRLAFNLLIDRNAICETVGQTGQVPASSYIPLGMADGNGGLFKATANANAYYDVNAINDTFDKTLEKAREYLRAAGFRFDKDGKLSAETPISIEYLTNDGTNHVAAAQIMQQDFAELGIQMSIQQMEWNTFLEERKKGHFDIAREGWLADFDDPVNMLEMFTTHSGNNDCQFGRGDGE